jgi:CubicO group peptidase (beta-lactamase class C family)
MIQKFPDLKLVRVTLVFVLLLGLGCSADRAGRPRHSPPEPVVNSSEFDLNSVDSALRTAVDRNTVAGASLLLVHNDEVIYKKAFGNLRVDDRVRIASSTKPVATVGVLLVVDDGKLDLNDTLAEWLPEFRGTEVANATLRDLLSHTSGIGGSYPGGRPTAGTLAEFSRLIASSGQLRSPGTFGYSGVGTDIACRMAEAALGIPFEDHLKTRVWQPLGMSHSRFYLAADPATVSQAELARGEGRWISCGGGMESTLDDMAQFYEMILQGGTYNGKSFLSPEMYREMTQKHSQNPRLANDPLSIGEYGLGLYRDRVAPDGSPLTLSHGGSYGTMPWTDLDTGLVGVFFTESRLPDVKPLIAEIQADVRPGVQQSAHSGTTPSTSSGAGTGNGRAVSEQSFKRISGGADVINLNQFQDYIENNARGDRLKGNPGRIERLFNRLDTNNDNELDFDEYKEIQNLRR